MIIESLHQMKRYCEINVEKYIATPPPDTESDELEIQWKANYNNIVKAIDLGSYIISDEAVKSLSGLQKDLKTESKNVDRSWLDYLESKLSLIKTSLEQIRKYARKDLKLGE